MTKKNLNRKSFHQDFDLDGMTPAAKRIIKHAIKMGEDGIRHIIPVCAECGKEAYRKLTFNPGPEAETEVFYFCPLHKSEVAHKILKGIGERNPETTVRAVPRRYTR